MTNKYIGTIIGLLLIIGIGGFVYVQKDNEIKKQITNSTFGTECDEEATDCIGDLSGETDDINSPQPSNASSSSDTLNSYTSTEVAQHANKASCWSMINGNVYDLTSWIPKHPGGEGAILSICGIDGSSTFNGQHGKSSKIANLLAGFKIGVAK